MNTGIYSISSPSGKFYIGSAVSFNHRWGVHRHLLRKGTHYSKQLQRAFNKYGEVGLVFKKLLICSKEDLIFYEQRAVDILKPVYNSCVVVNSQLGLKRSPETCVKMSMDRKGFKQSLEHVANRVAKNTGKKRTPEQIDHYVSMRDRAIICVETGQEFRSGKAVGIWCQEQKLTTSKNSFVSINRAIRLKR